MGHFRPLNWGSAVDVIEFDVQHTGVEPLNLAGHVQNVALETGAAAYVLKSAAAGDLIPAIERAMLSGKLEPHQPDHPSTNLRFFLGNGELGHSAIEAHSQLRKDPNNGFVEAVASGKVDGNLAGEYSITNGSATTTTHNSLASLDRRLRGPRGPRRYQTLAVIGMIQNH